jgi:hypothetical protein
MLGFILMPIIVYIEKIVFFLEKNASKKREITQIKCWIELSSLVNRTEKYNFSIIMIDIEMKLNIPVHYQMGNPLQQGRCILRKLYFF